MSRLAARRSLQDQAAARLVKEYERKAIELALGNRDLPLSLRKSFIIEDIKKREPSVGALLKREDDGKIFKITNKYMVIEEYLGTPEVPYWYACQNPDPSPRIMTREVQRFDLKDIDSPQEIKKVVWNDGFKWYFPNMDMKYVNLQGIWLQYMDFEGANFEGADLSRTYLQECNLENANFEGADLSGADIRKCKIENANFKKANVKEIRLTNIDFKGVDFEGFDFRDAIIYTCNFENANFEGADFRGATINDSNFENANFKWVDLRGKRYTSVADCNFEGADVTGTLYNKDTEFTSRRRTRYPKNIEMEEMKLDKNVMVNASTNRERDLELTLEYKKNLFYNTKRFKIKF